MLRVRWKTALAIAFAAATTSMAEGSPAGHLRASMERAISEVGGLVVRTHGSHLKCRYGKHGKSKDEWHRHDRGAIYPCASPSEEVQRSGPSRTGKGSKVRPVGPKDRHLPSVRAASLAGPKNWYLPGLRAASLVGPKDRPHHRRKAAMSSERLATNKNQPQPIWVFHA